MGNNMPIPLPTRSAEIVVVLIEPEISGNIGATARALLNFGCDQLRIVSESGYAVDDEAMARAKHAKSVLNSAQIYSNWNECMDDISLTVGTSGKRETGSKVSFRHFVLPEELAIRLLEVEGRVALVFGREGVGLTTEELQHCDFLVTIPTWEGYPILNLSHAVSVLMYEIHKPLLSSQLGLQEGVPQTVQPERLIDPNLRQQIHEVSDELAQNVRVHDSKRQGIAETLKRVIMRGMPLDDEAHRLLGVMTQARDALASTTEEE